MYGSSLMQNKEVWWNICCLAGTFSIYGIGFDLSFLAWMFPASIIILAWLPRKWPLMYDRKSRKRVSKIWGHFLGGTKCFDLLTLISLERHNIFGHVNWRQCYKSYVWELVRTLFFSEFPVRSQWKAMRDWTLVSQLRDIDIAQQLWLEPVASTAFLECVMLACWCWYMIWWSGDWSTCATGHNMMHW